MPKEDSYKPSLKFLQHVVRYQGHEVMFAFYIHPEDGLTYSVSPLSSGFELEFPETSLHWGHETTKGPITLIPGQDLSIPIKLD